MNVAYTVQGKKKRWQDRYSPSCAKDRSGNTFVRATRGEKIVADSLTLRSRGAPKTTVGKVIDLADAKEMAKGTLWKNSMGYMRAEGTIEGNAKLHPGMRLTIKGVSPRFEGEYRCRKVLHTLDRKTGFQTEFVAERNAKNRSTAVELRGAGVSPLLVSNEKEPVKKIV